ncbi:hypothetical protein XENOCAPTIV_014484, partial [Xenoophorus captivus]
ILSSEDKRASYDRYGQTDDAQAYSSGRYGRRQDSFYFDESFFNFPFNTKSHRDFTDSKYTLRFNQYVSEVVPDSYRRPYLIKITSDWCFSCIHIEPVWKDVAQEMEGLGVVDVGYERRLANHLSAHRTPSILGVISGKVMFFHYAVAKEHLWQFVEDLLPQRLVERDYLQFGYVDQGLAETAELQKRFNINSYAPTMLVFKENTDKPADIIQVVILERRNAAGRALFKPVTAWNGSEEDKLHLIEELERLQKDPSILTHDTMLPELNNEREMMPLLSQTLHFSFLNLDKHSEWMSTLLEYAQDQSQIDADEDDSRCCKMDYTGFVLALNGHKKYLCLFKPVYTGEDVDIKSSNEEGGASAGKLRPGSRDGHPPRKSSRSRSTSTLQIHHKLDRLGLWMERLMEGTLPRYYVPTWPGLEKIPPSK